MRTTHFFRFARTPAVCLAAIVGLFAALLPAKSHAQNIPIANEENAVLEWMARYDGPGIGHDEIRDAAADAAGNFIVTGESLGIGTGLDIATAKYDTDGNRLWLRRFDGPVHGNDAAARMAIDLNGDIVVTGYSVGNGTMADIITIKYDPNGNEQWLRRYDGPGHGDDRAHSIAIDANGNVFVAGESLGLTTDKDLVLIKYDSAGNEAWVRRYHGPGLGADSLGFVTVDALGNAYVAGDSEGIGTGFDIAVIKYNSAGAEQWVRRYDGPIHATDAPRAIILAPDNFLYVCGKSVGAGTADDYVLLKLSVNGQLIWDRRYDGPGQNSDIAEFLAADATGVYVTGRSFGLGTVADIATLKFSFAGVRLWVARFSGQALGADIGFHVAVDPAGVVTVVGESEGLGTLADVFLLRYAAHNGQELLRARFDGAGMGFDSAVRVAFDAANNVFVAGTSVGVGTGRDFIVLKFADPRAGGGGTGRVTIGGGCGMPITTGTHVGNAIGFMFAMLVAGMFLLAFRRRRRHIQVPIVGQGGCSR